MGIKAQWVKPWNITTKDSDFSSELKNILDEQFNPELPNAVWCSDITYIWKIDGFVYLTSIMDLYSRKIIAWTLPKTLEVSCVIETINKAKARRKIKEPLIRHSDRGSQYVSKEYKCDYSFYKEICSEEDEILISEMSYSYEEICNVICRCDLLISMRYHGALLGLLNHVKTLALLYDQHAHYYNKMTDLFEKFDAKQNLFTTIEELKKAIDDVNSIAQEEKEIDNSAYDWIINQISCDIKSGNLYKD